MFGRRKIDNDRVLVFGPLLQSFFYERADVCGRGRCGSIVGGCSVGDIRDALAKLLWGKRPLGLASGISG
jgi:hypothetical protein